MYLVYDTSFLMTALKLKVDPFSSVERLMDIPAVFAVVDKTVTELEKLINEGSYSDKKVSQLALRIIKSKGLKVISTKEGYADDALVALEAKEHIVATQDSKLKKRLKEKSFKVVTLRQKKYAVMV